MQFFHFSNGSFVYKEKYFIQLQEIPTEQESADLKEDQTRSTWPRNKFHTLKYKEHENHFKSTTIQIKSVWPIINNKFNNRSADQCKNEFKYLKSK